MLLPLPGFWSKKNPKTFTFIKKPSIAWLVKTFWTTLATSDHNKNTGWRLLNKLSFRLRYGSVMSYPDWKCEAVKKIRRKHAVTLFHLSLWEPLVGVSSHKLKSRLIVNQFGLGSCLVQGRCSVDWCLRWPWALQHPPPLGCGGLCVTWALCWVPDGSPGLLSLLNLQPDPLNDFNFWVFKTSVFLSLQLRYLSVGRCYT